MLSVECKKIVNVRLFSCNTVPYIVLASFSRDGYPCDLKVFELRR
jgi:hypothetical protein